MSKLPLRPLAWQPDLIFSNRISSVTDLYYYGIEYDPWAKKYEVEYQSEHGLPATGFATIDEAKQWAWNHYNEKMQPYVLTLEEIKRELVK